MSRGSYVVHNAFFDCGGPWGIIQTVLAAYIEERTGRKFHTFFDSFSGASIGGVNAIVLGLGIPAKTLSHAIYACSIDLFKDASNKMVRNQILNSKLGLRLKDHHDHMLLYHTLAPYFGTQVMADIKPSILMAAHNMDRKLNFWFGRMDPGLFDEQSLKYPLINGTTPLLDAAMAATSIPGVFRPWEFNGEHYRDFGAAISPGKAHKELDAALQSRRDQLLEARRAAPKHWRERIAHRFNRHANNDPRTLENADSAVVRTLFIGTGDLSNLPYTKAVQNNAGIMGALDEQEYSTLHFMKQNAHQEDDADMSRYFDPKTMTATGRPAISKINKSLVWKAGDAFEKASFPSLAQMDCSPGNLHKVFHFAALNIEQHMQRIVEALHEINVNQYAQGRIDHAEYARMNGICSAMITESPWRILENEGILVTAANANAVYQEYRPRVPENKTQAAARSGVMSYVAGSVANVLWRTPAATIG